MRYKVAIMRCKLVAIVNDSYSYEIWSCNEKVAIKRLIDNYDKQIM